jgi:hypothetical protein
MPELPAQDVKTHADCTELPAVLRASAPDSDDGAQSSSSGDWFVRRARPGFLWAMTAALLLNAVLPLINRFCGGHMEPLHIDSDLYSLMKTCIVGLAAMRTVEKLKDKD